MSCAVSQPAAARHVGVIGLGYWGTALATHLARLGHHVTGWSRDADLVQSIQDTKRHLTCFPEHTLPFTATTKLEALLASDMIIVALPTRAIAEYDFAAKLTAHQYLISVMKGFELASALTPCAFFQARGTAAKLATLSGPSFAIDVMDGTPVAVSAAASSKTDAQAVANLFHSSSMRVYLSDDLIGVELGGALKNIIALASGICAGLCFGDSTKAALMTRGLAEMTRFAVHFGARSQTLSGLSGLGDLILTASSMQSRNYSFGYKLGQGATPEQAALAVGSTTEGVFSTPVVTRMAKQHGIAMPITEALNQVLLQVIRPEDMVGLLMTRPATEE